MGARDNILKFTRKVQKVVLFHIQSDTLYAKRRFKRTFGQKLNLSEPRMLNEKIQWLKLYDRNPAYTIISDKFRVREIIKKTIGEKYLVPLIFETEDPKEINSDNISEFPVIVKANHNSSANKVLYNESTVDWTGLQFLCKRWLKENYYRRGREWPYKNIEPRIIVEKLLSDENGNLPFDYKFHCFHGEVKFLQVDIDRASNMARNFYSLDWELLPFEWAYKNGRSVPRPTVLEDMVHVASKLCEKYRYCRVDLYEFLGKVYFGELTLYPGNGFKKILPPEYEYELGKYLRLPFES